MKQMHVIVSILCLVVSINFVLLSVVRIDLTRSRASLGLYFLFNCTLRYIRRSRPGSITNPAVRRQPAEPPAPDPGKLVEPHLFKSPVGINCCLHRTSSSESASLIGFPTSFRRPVLSTGTTGFETRHDSRRCSSTTVQPLRLSPLALSAGALRVEGSFLPRPNHPPGFLVFSSNLQSLFLQSPGSASSRINTQHSPASPLLGVPLAPVDPAATASHHFLEIAISAGLVFTTG